MTNETRGAAMKTTYGATVTVQTQANGKKWVKVSGALGGEKFRAALEEVAQAFGVDVNAPDCRVVFQGKKIWQADRETVWVSMSTGYTVVHNVAGYWLSR